MTTSEFSAGGLGAAGIPDEAAGIPDEKVDEAVWAELVAAFEGPSADVSGRRLPPFAGTSEAPARAASGEGGRPLESARPEAATSDVDDDFPEEHFEPDPPPPLPRLGWLMGTAWLAVLGTPVLFLIALWVHVDVTGWLGAIGVSCFVGGFLILVSRLGDGPDEWDDGAVV